MANKEQGGFQGKVKERIEQFIPLALIGGIIGLIAFAAL
jgi:hypothetical protein